MWQKSLIMWEIQSPENYERSWLYLLPKFYLLLLLFIAKPDFEKKKKEFNTQARY